MRGRRDEGGETRAGVRGRGDEGGDGGGRGGGTRGMLE